MNDNFKWLNSLGVLHLSFLLALVLCFSCSDKKETIVIKPELIESVSLSSIIDGDIEYVQLDTTVRIGSIQKILVTDERIYVIGSGIVSKIYVFNADGEFMFNLGEVGQSPRSYLSPSDLAEVEDEIEVSDSQGKSIIRYRKSDGKFISKHLTGIPIQEFTYFGGTHFNYTSYESDDGYVANLSEDHLNTLNILNSEFDSLSVSYFPTDRVLDNFCGPMGRLGTFGNNLLFTRPVVQEIYEYDEESFLTKYKIDFGEYQWKIDPLELRDDVDQLRKNFFGKKVMSVVHNVIETESNLVFQTYMSPEEGDFVEDDNIWLCIYSKSSNQTRCYNRIENDIDDVTFTFPVENHGENFISLSTELISMRNNPKLMIYRLK